MSTFVYFVAKKFASKGWVLKVSHFQMNNITIIYIIVVIVVMSEANKLKTATTKSWQRGTATLGRFETKECSKGKPQSCRFVLSFKGLVHLKQKV